MTDDNDKLKVDLDPHTLKKVLKDYKKLKKYMRSSIYQVKSMDGTEETITKLIKYLDEP
jgi:hypothetical protein